MENEKVKAAMEGQHLNRGPAVCSVCGAPLSASDHTSGCPLQHPGAGYGGQARGVAFVPAPPTPLQVAQIELDKAHAEVNAPGTPESRAKLEEAKKALAEAEAAAAPTPGQPVPLASADPSYATDEAATARLRAENPPVG